VKQVNYLLRGKKKKKKNMVHVDRHRGGLRERESR